jgi:hypothetical protein
VNRATAEAVSGVARLLDVDPQDPAITFGGATFPTVAWYPSEDKAAFPVQALLLLIATLTLLVRPDPDHRSRRILAAIVVLGVGLHSATVKWQPWGNRLVLFLVVLAAPLAGLWIARTLERVAATGINPGNATSHATPSDLATPSVPARPKVLAVSSVLAGPRVLAALTAFALVIGGTAGWLTALYGWPRRLVGSQSVLVLSTWETRFVARPEWAADYAAVGAAVRASGARRIGLVQGNDTWEYPWWLVFPDREIVALQSMVATKPPPARDSLDAIVCATPVDLCRFYAPKDWSVHTRGSLSFALPTRR